MSRFAVFGFVLVLAAVVFASTDPEISNEVEPSVVIVDANTGFQASPAWNNIFQMEHGVELKDTRATKPQVMDLLMAGKLTAVPTTATSVGDIIRYTIGKRVQNDRLVAHGADGKRWTTPQDVTLALRYPNSGQGAIVTYAEIVVNQSSNSGKAVVNSGGIGQRFISFIVQAQNTMWFSYTVDIYGL